MWMSTSAFLKVEVLITPGVPRKEMTDDDFFNPTYLHARDCKLTILGGDVKLPVLIHASILGMTFHPRDRYQETPGIPHVG